MTSTSDPAIHCTVAGAELLPANLGGQSGICLAIAKAAVPALRRAGLPTTALSVSVTVKSRSWISAVPALNGKLLPQQNVAISDRTLNANAIAMLANAVAAEISAWSERNARGGMG